VRQKPVVRRRRADDDIEATLAYYLNEAGPEVVADFVDRLEEALKRISRRPGVGSPRYGHVIQISELRSWPIKSFPYQIYYLEKTDHIELSRVLHSSNDVPSWLNDVE